MTDEKNDLDETKPKIVPMPDIPLTEMEKQLALLENNYPSMIKYQVLVAGLAKAKYDALIEQGFTDAQAIELCKKLY